MKKITAGIVLVLLHAGTSLFGQPSGTDFFSHWSDEASPQKVGAVVANRFLEVPRPYYDMPNPPKVITYFEVCTWYGALTFASLAKDTDLSNRLAGHFEPLFGEDSIHIPPADHVDNTVFGSLALELYLQTRDPRYKAIGLRFADAQWEAPPATHATEQAVKYHNEGLSWQTRLWIDDMYMITMIQSQAYRATGNKKYVDRAAEEMVFYLNSLQKSNGLFYHAPEIPFFWGRGNGWMAAGMTELLRVLPKDNPNRARIMEGYKTMMASLLEYQSEQGMWRQLINDPDSWPETSCTGMFTFAMITGVKNGWLDANVYGEAARKAWLALITYLDENGDVREVCQGTGAKNDRQYYLDRQRITGDFHGQAPILWCATALLR